MEARRGVGLLIVLLIAAGCDSSAKEYRSKMDSFSPQPVATDPDSIASLQQRLKEALNAWDDRAPAAAKTVARDSILDLSLELSDDYFKPSSRDHLRGRALLDGSRELDLANLVSPAASTAVRRTSGKDRGFSAVATSLAKTSGFPKLAVDTNLYFQQTAPALTAKMRALRAAKYNEIIKHKKLAAGDYSIYTLADVNRDLTEYFEAGTVYAAVVDIARVSRENQEAKAGKRSILIRRRRAIAARFLETGWQDNQRRE